MKSFKPCITRMPIRRSWPVLFTTAACAVLLQACGGGGGGGSDVASPAPDPGNNPDTVNPSVPQPTEPPVVRRSPDSLTVTVRQPAFFDVDGSATTYQWQRNGVDIPGATQRSYNFVAQPADAGVLYRVVLSNAVGSVTSNPALLTVLDAPTGDLALVAGSIGGGGNLDGVGASARFDGPFALAADAAGDLLVAGGGLRRITPGGRVTRFGAFYEPTATGVAVDPTGNTYLATNGRFPGIVRIAPDGSSTRIADLRSGAGPIHIALDCAGNVIVVNGSDLDLLRIDPASGQQTVPIGGGGSLPGVSRLPAPFGGACDVAIDTNSNIVFTDASTNTVRSLGPDGKLITLVPASAGLLRPCGLAFDRSGNLLIADSGNRVIRKFLPDGTLSTVAGVLGDAGMQDGPAASARFTQPTTLAAGPDGNLYIGDNHTVRRLDNSGNVTTIAGLAGPTGPAFGSYHATDAAGNVYVAVQASTAPDSGYLLQKIAPTGEATTLATGLSSPQGIAVDDAANVYIADAVKDCSGGRVATSCDYTAVLLKFDAAQGRLGVLAGSPTSPPAGSAADVNGVGTAARFNYIVHDVAVDASGNVYVGQASMVRKVTPDGTVSTLTTATGARGLTVDRKTGDVLSAICNSVSVSFLAPQPSRIDPAGNVTPLLARDYRPDRQDYLADRPLNNCPEGMAVDAAGNVFIAYPTASVVRKLAPDGTSTTVVGRPDQAGIAPGPLPASLLSPSDLSFDNAGNLIIGSTQAILKARFSK